MPPPEPPPPAAPKAAAPVAVAQPTPTGTASSGTPTPGSDMKEEETEPEDDSRSLPFLKKRSRPKGPNPVFEGTPAAAPKSKRKVRIRSNPVSPLERHWGGVAAKEGAKKDLAALFEEDEPKEEASASKKSKKGEYQLVLYRLNGKTGAVETFERAFHSNRSREAALARKTAEGYRLKRPSAKDIQAIKDKKATSDKGKKKEKSNGKQAEKDCPVRVTWSTGDGASRTEQSRCFKTREAAQKFQQQRRKATGPRGNRPGARRGPRPDGSRAAPPTRSDSSLQPQNP